MMASTNENKISRLDTRMAVVENKFIEQNNRILKHREESEKKYDEIMDIIDKMRLLLSGDMNEKGIVATLREHENWISKKDNKVMFFSNLIYKAIILFGLAWISTKININL